MSQVALILPPYGQTEQINQKQRKRRGFIANYPHLGLGYIAAALEKAGKSVNIIDFSVSDEPVRDVLQRLVRSRPEMIGITTVTMGLPATRQVIGRVRDLGYRGAILVGGPHPTLIPESAFKLGADYGFVGEAEPEIASVLDFVTGRSSKQPLDIPGLVFQADGKACLSGRSTVADLDGLPYPARHLFDQDRYFSPVTDGRMTSMVSSRGCPFDCAYCSRVLPERRCTLRSAPSVVAEMEHVWLTHQVKYVNFEDDTFTLKRSRVLEIAHLLGERGIDLRWGCQTRANLVDYDMLRAMKDAGCVKISFGVESGAERVRHAIGKPISDRSFRDAFQWCRELGIETTAFMMLGHPTETAQDIQKSIDFSIELRATYVMFDITKVVPGAPLYQRWKDQGKIDDSYWDGYMEGKAPVPNFVPEGMTLDDLKRWHRIAYLKNYLRPQFLLEKLRSIKSPRDLVRKLRIGLVLVRDFIAQ